MGIFQPVGKYAILLLLCTATVLAGCKKQETEEEVVYEGPEIKDGDANSTDYVDPFGNDEPQKAVNNNAVLEEEEEEEDLNEVLSKCGIADFSDREAVTFEQEMYYDFVRTVEAGFFNIYVDMAATIKLINKLEGLTFIVTVDVGDIEIEGDANYDDIQPVLDQALGEAREFAGEVVGTAIPQNSNFTEEWKNLVCTIPGAKSLVTTRDGYETEVEFTPGIPPAISPIADAERYPKELKEVRFFPDIEAKIIRTNNPLLEEGQIIKGNITVERIEPSKTSPDGTKSVSAESAYRVTNYFGTREQTLAIGFHLWNEYYINHSTKRFAAVFADVGGPNLQYFVDENAASAPVVEEGQGDNGGGSTVSFATDIKPIVDRECSGCHNSAPRQPLSEYADITAGGTAEDVVRRVQIPGGNGGTMPPASPLSSGDIEKFKKWEAGGYQP